MSVLTRVHTPCYGSYMSTATESVKYTISSKGTKRAQIFNCSMMRWMGISVAKADLMVATGAAEDLTNEWHIGGRQGL